MNGLLSDVWLNIQVGFYRYKDKDLIPSKSGVYAWFYPLEIRGNSFDKFIDEIKTIFSYDSGTENIAIRKTNFKMCWKKIKVSIEMQIKDPNQNIKSDGKSISQIWDEAFINKEDLFNLKKALLKASIFLPPLYIGKTINLSDRYFQHCAGVPGSFKERYDAYITQNKIYKDFEDLLFVCIETDMLPSNTEVMLEEILKVFSQPVFSKI